MELKCQRSQWQMVQGRKTEEKITSNMFIIIENGDTTGGGGSWEGRDKFNIL